MKTVSNLSGALIALCLAVSGGFGQTPVLPTPAKPLLIPSNPAVAAPASPKLVPSSEAALAMRKSYVLGPDDQISLHVLDAPDLSDKPFRIETSGEIRLPRVGRIQAAGLTPQQLEAKITERLKDWLRDPDVSVSVVEHRSQSVSVLGAVKAPGVQQMQGQMNLVEALSAAGGLTDDAGYAVKITRRLEWGRIPLPTAADDSTGEYSVAEAGIDQILSGKNPGLNIVLYPLDVVSVPRAQMIYVVGQVLKAGGFILQERKDLSLLQALALAGGTDKNAAGKKAKILRPSADGNRTEILVDIPKVIAGKAPDPRLQPEDILFVPASTSKKVLSRVGDIGALASTALIYRIP